MDSDKDEIKWPNPFGWKLLQNFECIPSNLLGNEFVALLFGVMLYEHISMMPMFEYFEEQQWIHNVIDFHII